MLGRETETESTENHHFLALGPLRAEDAPRLPLRFLPPWEEWGWLTTAMVSMAASSSEVGLLTVDSFPVGLGVAGGAAGLTLGPFFLSNSCKIFRKASSERTTKMDRICNYIKLSIETKNTLGTAIASSQ